MRRATLVLNPKDYLLAAPWTKAGCIQRALLDLLREHERDGALPTNGRFLFYELEQRGVVPKHYLDDDGKERARTPANDVTDASMVLRKVGLVPWEWFTDETRDLYSPLSCTSVLEHLRILLRITRIDPWLPGLAPLIICESKAVKGVQRDVTNEYRTPITATGGQCGGFLRTDVAPMLRGNQRRVLYIGDHEMRGPADQIEANTRRVLEREVGRTIDWTRIALTAEQVADDPRLQALEITKHDRRYKPAKAYQAVECEAIGQLTLVNLVRAVLDDLLPQPLEDVQAREEEERDRLAEYLDDYDLPCRA